MQRVPEPSIRRLIRYYRHLASLDLSEEEVILSLELGKKTGVTAAQVRKDLSYLGEVGQKGVGYKIEFLKKELAYILGFDRDCAIVIIGAGNLGRALCCYRELERLGIRVAAIFDNDLNKIGTRVNQLEVKNIKHLDKFIRKNNIKIAVLTVPSKAVESITAKIIKAGINNIWNFAPVALSCDEKVRVFSEDLASDLGSLIYHLNNL
mgnify:CR=1 FL=1